MPLTQVSSRLIEDTLRYVLGANGTSDYTFTGKGLTGAVNDPTLTLSRGHTYIFENRNSSGAHPFYIKTSIANGGTNDAYNTGVTNNGGAGGTEIVFTVPHDAPDVLYYQCSSHINMAGQLKIAGAVADGSITEAKLADDAVTADKLANSINTAIAANTAKTSNATHTGDVTGSTSLTIANDAVTNAKIAANAVGTTEIADNAVTTTKIPDEGITLAKLEHGTSSNDGKFLRANNGADPTFETITVPVGIPSGGIIIWSGAANAIPTGFVLCDGNNSTPDLRDRFVVGAQNAYAVGDTGGADSVTLTVAQMPSHTHTLDGRSGSYGSGQPFSAKGAKEPFWQNMTTDSTGGGQSHENRPPYYALCYIMKT